MSRYIHRCTRDITSIKLTRTIIKPTDQAFMLSLRYQQPDGQISYIYEKYPTVETLQKRHRDYIFGYCHQCGHVDFCPRSNFSFILCKSRKNSKNSENITKQHQFV
jgi:hypothetical protein